MGFWTTLGQQAAGTAATGLIGGTVGQIFKHWNDKKQIKQQKKLNVENERMMEVARQMELQSMEDAHSHQAIGMKKAGLNAALMYGGAGAGGVTSRSSAGGAQAAAGQESATAAAGMGMGLTPITMAQIRNIEAQTAKTQAETKNISEGGVDYNNTEANTGLTKAKTVIEEGNKKIQDVAIKVQEGTIEEQIGTIVQTYGNMQEQFRVLEVEANKAQGTQKTEIDRIRKEEEITRTNAINAILTTSLIKSQDAAIAQQIKESKTRQGLVNAQTGYTNGLTGKLKYEIAYMSTQIAETVQKIQHSKSDIEIRKLRQELDTKIFEWQKEMKLNDNVREDVKFGIDQFTGIIKAAL